jgi:hypothetical protein
VNLTEWAHAQGIHVTTAYRWYREGTLPHRTVPPGRGVDVWPGHHDRVRRRGQPLAQPAQRLLRDNGVPVDDPRIQLPSALTSAS